MKKSRKLKKSLPKNFKKKYKRVPKSEYLKDFEIEIISLDSKETKRELNNKSYQDYLMEQNNYEED